jgi:hypothetical protein
MGDAGACEIETHTISPTRQRNHGDLIWCAPIVRARLMVAGSLFSVRNQNEITGSGVMGQIQGSFDGETVVRP